MVNPTTAQQLLPLLAIRIVVFFLSAWPLLCWLYTLSHLLRSHHGPFASSSKKSLWRTSSTSLLLAYCLIENVFSLYHLYLSRKIQRPGPRPIYGRRFLRYVFSRALEGGMRKQSPGQQQAQHANAGANGISIKPDRGEGTAYSLRKRLAPPALEPITVLSRADSPVPKRPAPSATMPYAGDDNANAERAAEDDRAARIRRLRSVSYVPSFVDDELHRDDPRAKAFVDEYRQWFWNVPVEALTRRDVEYWLAWALYAAELEDIEAESHKEHAEGTVPPRDGMSSPAPPEWTEPSKNSIHRPSLASRKQSSSSAYSEEDVRGTRAAQGEWDDPVRGTRLDFLHYCRELIEARQGFALPEEPHPDYISLRRKVIRGPELRTMRLTVDPVRVAPRPLALYLITNALTYLAIRKAIRGGFRKEKQGRLSYLIYRPPGWSPEKAIKDGTPRFRPIIFLHGLGIGLSQYIEVINFFLEDPQMVQRPILIPLQPHISQNIFSPNFLRPLGHHETTAALRRIFKREGWDHPECGFETLGHSWGTIMASWVLKSFPDLARRTCLVDPVCFKLWEPHVCANFVYVRANTAMKVMLRYFVARELGTAQTLCRAFDWSSNLLWTEEIPNIDSPHHTRIFLASEDAILSAKANYNYLIENGMKDDKEGGGLYFAEGLAHGEVMMRQGVGMEKIRKWLKGLE